jgi:hypothetical protein
MAISTIGKEAQAMNDCSRCWTYHMEAMALSRHVGDPQKRRTLIRTAYVWLNRYFDAEDREIARRERLAQSRSRVR